METYLKSNNNQCSCFAMISAFYVSLNIYYCVFYSTVLSVSVCIYLWKNKNMASQSLCI